MYHKIMRAVLVALVALCSIGAVAPQPTLAASGGGCSTSNPRISSCISYSYSTATRQGRVISDFYMNGYPDSSYYWACVEIHSSGNGVTYYSPCVRLNRNGRFGTFYKNVGVGQAFTRVRIYTSDWRIHGYVDSPRVYYP